ncbi:MAG TPA: DUF1573 domain-containing protein [Bacteroidales bacterium]|jgi:hypothetical protein|nr:DUF1573 domain-containing protein [Bacteroidales bacterium]
MKWFLFLLAALLLSSPPTNQEDGRVVFEKPVHDFGDFKIDDGPKTHTFSFTNKWDKPVVIQRVISSCGCAAPEWTRHPVASGAKGEVIVTFNNDIGPYPFDKSLSVYFAGIQRPYILRIRGVVHRKPVSVAQTHPIVMGPLRLKKQNLDLGQIRQGLTKTDSIEIINTSKRPVFLKAKSNHLNLLVRSSSGRIDPGEKSFLIYTVDSRKEQMWGDVLFHANLIINNKENPLHVVTVKASVKMNPEGLSASDKRNAPIPQMNKSAFNFATTKSGSDIQADFILYNKGKTRLVVYKIDTEHQDIQVQMKQEIAPADHTPITVRIPGHVTRECGEVIYTISLTTNAPSRPTIHVLIYGSIE